MVQTQKRAPLTLVLSGLDPGGPALRTAAPRAPRTLSLLRHRRRAIVRRPDAGSSRVIGSPSGLRAVSGHWRSIADRVRDRAATGSAEPSSAAQPSPPGQSLPDAGRSCAPARPRFQCLAGNPRVCLRSVRKRSRRANLEYSFPWLDRLDFYRFGLPTRTLAAHFAGTIRKRVCAYATNLLARFGNPCDVLCRSSGITRSPYKEKKQR